MPVLVVCGERDEKFTALGRRMVDAIGTSATMAIVAGAGHAPHLQFPDAVADLVRAHVAS
jgi:pimeloyl-ACP methyl ester carboxylesterase